MMMVDILFLHHGFKWFDTYTPVNAKLTKFESVKGAVRRTRSGSQGAIYENFVKPDIEYEYIWNGVSIRGVGLSLFEPEAGINTDDALLLSSDINPNFKELKVGITVTAWVNKKKPYESYLYSGANLLIRSSLSWLKIYCLFAIFFVFSFGIIGIAKISKRTR